ncbi:MAG TPA: hypothetical protein VGX25_03290 [Actinophytocola sp.]|uniref:DUF7455 domain-containing protein n=1 Tax=Actinophytocola sp. TaxID=1872138 RepID=UPI002DDD06B7|nr:hypothetical protein [Actinophytocola sp.]HEV2778403.1 hypothetical protein [Actinophytocola sp.]
MTPTLTRPELVADRCDRCPNTAQVRVILQSGGELLFCGHHARKHSARLVQLAARLQHA